MQSYLSDYVGARSNPEAKFIRAVNSIINQNNPDWELIIVADGCKITEDLYNKNFKKNEKIRFKFIEKPDNTRMYEGDVVYFRGMPRAVGVEIAKGDWICYLDTDDMFKPYAIDKIIKGIKKHNKDIKYLFNLCICENIFQYAVTKRMNEKHSNRKHNDIILSEPYEIEGLESYWFDNGYNYIPTGTAFLIHRNGWPKHTWGDKIGGDNKSEDMVYVEKILTVEENHKEVAFITAPYYIRCHYRDRWDL